MPPYDFASRFQRASGSIDTMSVGECMDSRFVLGCAMPIKLVQFQSKLSEPKISQHFGIKTAFTAISDSVLRTQNFSCSCGDEIMPSFALNIFQCRSWRNFIVLILGVLFKSLKLSRRIGLAMAGYFSLVLKRQLNQLFQSMAFLWLLTCKFMHTMVERQAFFCSTQAEDIYSDGELRSRARDRGAENKMCFKTIMAPSDQRYSLHVTWTPVLFIVEESINNLKSGCLTFFEDLACSDAMYQCRVVNIDKRQLKYLVHSASIKIIVGDCQNHYWSHLTCLRFQQYVLRYLVFLPNVYVGASTTRNFPRARFLMEDLITFPCWFRPRPSGRKERPQQAKRSCFLGRGLGRGCIPLPNHWLHPAGMFPYC